MPSTGTWFQQQTVVRQRCSVREEGPLRVAIHVPASSVCCEVKLGVVTRVTSRWHMHVTAAQPAGCHIQTWRHLHLLRLSPHLTEYEVCVTVLQVVINKSLHHVLLSLSSVLLAFTAPTPNPTPTPHTCGLFKTLPPPAPFSSFHPSLFLYSHCDLELHAARRRTKWLASLLFVFFLCCEL